jgi:hypothetical protein
MVRLLGELSGIQNISKRESGFRGSYGYDAVKKLDGNGEPVRGDRTINETQARVVERIFRDYALGKSAKTIAFALNKEGIPAPSGGGSPELRSAVL